MHAHERDRVARCNRHHRVPTDILLGNASRQCLLDDDHVLAGIKMIDCDCPDVTRRCLVEHEAVFTRPDGHYVIHSDVNGVVAVADRYRALEAADDHVLVAVAEGVVSLLLMFTPVPPATTVSLLPSPRVIVLLEEGLPTALTLTFTTSPVPSPRVIMLSTLATPPATNISPSPLPKVIVLLWDSSPLPLLIMDTTSPAPLPRVIVSRTVFSAFTVSLLPLPRRTRRLSCSSCAVSLTKLQTARR